MPPITFNYCQGVLLNLQLKTKVKPVCGPDTAKQIIQGGYLYTCTYQV